MTKRNKCHLETCTKRILLSDMPCICHNIYCMLHRLPEVHDCSGNYKSNPPKVEGCKRDKVIKI